MKGCRPLTDEEIAAVMGAFSGVFEHRNRALFMLGLKTGFRISELLSLRVCDLIAEGKVVKHVTVDRRNMKGGKAEGTPTKADSRTVPLHRETHPHILAWCEDMQRQGYRRTDNHFFQSRKAGDAPLDRKQAWKALTDAYRAVGLSGRIGTHGMRKTFARIKLEYLKDRWQPGKEIPIQALQRIMGHKDISSTQQYVEFADEDVEAAFLES